MIKLLLSLLLIITLFSCSSTRRETKIDNKAIGRVLSKSPLIDQVGKIYLGLHPVVQTPIYIKGKDSITEIPVYVDVVRDKIIKEKYPDLNLDSLRNAVMKIITIMRVDTIERKDLSTIALLNAEQISHSLTKGKLTQVQEYNGSLKIDLNKSHFWLYVSISGALLIIAGLIYVLYIKGIKKAALRSF